MGDGDDEPAQAAPGRGAPLKVTGRRRPTIGLALVLLVLIALWAAGGALLDAQVRARHQARTAETVDIVGGLLREAELGLLREARILARDPAVVEGVVKGDWATLARGASPRMIALMTERVADLLLITDAAGDPLVQVPAMPRVAIPDLAPPPEPPTVVRSIGGTTYLLAVAVIQASPPRDGDASEPVGLAVVGRRFARLEDVLAGVPARPALVALGGDRLLAATRAGLPATGWDVAIRGGPIPVGGEAWTARPLDNGLWALLPDPDDGTERRRLLAWLLGSLVVVLSATIVAWLAAPSGGRTATDRRPAEPRSRTGEAIHALTKALEGGADLTASLEQALEAVRAAARMEVGAVYRVDAATGTLRLLAQRGINADDLHLFQARPLDQSHVGETARAGRPTVTRLGDSPLLDEPLRQVARVAGHRTQLALPIVASGATWGVIALVSTQDRTFDADEVRLFETVALLVGAAVARAALQAETHDKGRRLESLTHLAETLTATLGLEEVLERVVQAGVRISGASLSRLWLLDEDGEHLSLRASAGMQASGGVTRLRIGEGLTGGVAATRAPLVVEDALNDPRMRNVDLFRAEGAVSFAGVPLVVGDRLLGVLLVALRERHPYTSEEIVLLQSLANYAAIAIDNARLFAEEKSRRDHLAALLEINKKIGSAESTDALLTVIAEEAARLLDVDNAGFWLVEGDDLVLAGMAGTAREGIIRPRLKVGESLAGRVVAEGCTLIVDIEAFPGVVPEQRAADRELGYSWFLGVPLRLGGRIVGVLTCRGRRPFTPRDRELAEAFAGQAAIALDHTRLYREATQQAQRMGALAAIERLLSETLDPDVVAQRIADSLRSLLDARASVVYRLEPDSGALRALAVSGDVGPMYGRSVVVPRGAGVTGLALSERRPVASADLLADPRITLPADLRARIEAAQFRAALAVPLGVHDRAIGALFVGDRAGRVFSDRDVRLAQAFADQAAHALENARLFSSETARRAQIETLADIERELTAELNVDRLLTLIVERASRLFGANGVIYLLAGDSALVPRAWSERATSDQEVPVGQGLVGSCAAERRGLLCNDFPQSPYALPELQAGDTRHAIAYPLIFRDRLLGVIIMARSGPAAASFRAEDLGALEQFATQAALALENARLHEETERRRRQAEELARLARTLTESLNVAEVCARIVEHTPALLGVWSAGVRLLRPNGSLEPALRGGDARAQRALSIELPPGTGVSSRAVATGRAVWSRDVLTDPEIVLTEEVRKAVERSGTHAYLAVPLRVKSTTIGALVVNDTRVRDFSATDAELLQALGDQAALALENARLHEETERRRREAEVLAELARTINASLDLDTVLQRVCEGAIELCGSGLARIALRNPDTGEVAIKYSVGARSDTFRTLTLAPGQGVAGVVLATGQPFRTDNWLEDPRITKESAALVQEEGIVTALCVPIRIGDRLEGLVIVNNRAPRPFTDRDEAVLVQLADQTAIAIQNTRLFTEAQERLRETTTLLAIGRVLSEPATFEEMLRRVAREAAHAFAADMVGAYVLNESREHLTPVAGYRVPADLRDVFLRNPITLTRVPTLLEAWRGGQAIWSSDPQHDARFDPDWVRLLPPLSVLLAPTRVRGESVGALILVWWRTGREFQPSEIRLVEGIAAQVGLALENAELARQTQVKLRETETLLAVTRPVAFTLDLPTLLRGFLREAFRVLDADSVGVWMVQEDGEWLEPTAGYRVPPERVAAVRQVRVSTIKDEFYAEARRTRRPVFAADCASDPRMPRTMLALVPHKSQLFVPIFVNDRMIAGFIAPWWERPGRILPGELALLEAIANQIGVALENVRLFQQHQRRLEELSTLHELSRAVTGQLEREALLATLRAQVPRILEARKFTVLLFDEKSGELEAALRVQDGVEDASLPRRYPATQGLAAVVLVTGHPLRADDYRAECARQGVELPPVTGFDRWLGVPMRVGTTTLGVLTVSRDARPFSDGDERLLANVADLAALALRSAWLFAERTRAYSDLAAAQDHLVRTEKLRALGEMASGVAHDFNNLLAAILGRTQLLLRRVEDAKLRQWLQVIERSALDGAQTVRRLQEFARVRHDAPMVPLDLNVIVREALEITQSRWREESLRRGITIDVQTALASVPPVAGDPAELREAMTNLILNAVDAMPEGGTLRVTTALTADGVELTVSDSGVGIPEDIRERIFDPFFTTKGPQGTGLGLSMTYGIISRHVGRIAVESAEGQGTTFRLTFPPTEHREDHPPAPAPPSGPARPRRCLVVDDEEVVGAVIGDALEALGHEPVVVTDGAAAIARFRAEAFDVVFTDLAMPGTSGWQVVQAVKAVAPDVPVFVVTGFGVELTAEERSVHGVEAVYTKPLKIDDIIEAMAHVARRPATSHRREDS